jgi:hypothetical protein
MAAGFADVRGMLPQGDLFILTVFESSVWKLNLNAQVYAAEACQLF